MKFIKFLAIIICLIAMASRTADAVVNPENFKRGPEQLVIIVTDTTVEKNSASTIVRLRAKVVSVKRTATALKPGDTILIRYQRYPATIKRQMEQMVRQGENGWAGQQPLYQPQPPEIDAVVEAILHHLGGNHGRVYQPAAYQYSFEPAQ